jgi:ABC-type transport system involved in Fe-S cluster assembly fused permease/ATPase subunit
MRPARVIRDPSILARMRATSDLYEAAEDLMRQRLRREHPGETAAQIERRLISWLQKPRDP